MQPSRGYTCSAKKYFYQTQLSKLFLVYHAYNPTVEYLTFEDRVRIILCGNSTLGPAYNK